MDFLQLPIVKAYLDMLKNYIKFSERTSRPDYWWAFLANVVIMAVFGLLSLVLGTISSLLMFLYSVAIIVPSTALAVRRLHDIGKSGWCVLIGLIPVVGWIILLIWLAKDGDPGDNMYGSDPNSLYGY